MAQIVKLRRSSVSGQKPTNSNLQLGELALNTTDGKVYMAKSGSLGPSVEELITTNAVNTGSITISGSINLLGNQSITGSLIVSDGVGYINTGLIAENSDLVLTSGSDIHVEDGGIVSASQIWGDGSHLINIPASGVTGLELYKIVSGSVSASISPDRGLEINTDTTITGSFTVSGSTLQVGNNTLLGTTLLSGSITISGSLDPSTPSVRIYGDTQTDGVIRFDPVSKNIDTSISASYLFVSSSTNDLYFSQNGNGFSNITRLRWVEGNLYSGLLNGGLITATPGSTTFNIGAGSGIIVNLNASLTDNPYPTIKYVNWNAFTGQTLTYRTTHIQTYIAIDNNGEILQSNTPFVATQYNTLITLGTVIHQNLSTVNASITYPNVAYGYKQRSYDFLKAFGPLKLSGLNLVTTGSLGLNVGSGTAFADGRNYQNDPNNPSYITDSGTAVSKIFRYYQVSGSTFVQDTNNGTGYTDIDPANYVLNGVLTSAGGSYSIQRVFWYPNSATKGIVVYYGNAIYNTIREAIDNINIEPFNETENTKQNAVLLGTIIIKGNGDFTDTNDYAIVPGGLFRSVGGSGGGGTVPTQRLFDLSDVDVTTQQDNDLLVYNVDTLKWEPTKSLEGDYTITGSLNVTGGLTGSLDFSNITNTPTLVSGSSQIEITGTTGYSEFSGSISSSIGELSSSVATTTFNVENRLDSIEGVTGSYATTGSNVFIGDQTITGSLFVSNSFFVGSGTNDIVRIKALISSSLIPDSDGIHHFVGAQNKRWEAVYAKTGSFEEIHGTLGSIVNIFHATVSGSFTGDGTGLYNIPASGVTGLQLDKIINGNASASIDDTGLYVNRNVYIDGTLTAKELHIDYVTSSVLYQSGSTKFGDSSDDNHSFTGSVYIGGNLNVDSITGSLSFDNLTDLPTLVSGSSQIEITGTTGYSTFSGSISSSIDTLSSSIALTDYNQELRLNSIESFTSSYATGSFTGSFIGDGSGLLDIPFLISGSNIYGTTVNKTFTKLQFDDSTGLNVEETTPGTAFISIGSHFKDIFVSGSPILSATGSDAFEIIPAGGIEITTSTSDTNGNGYVKELNISATSLSSSLNDRIDIITGSVDSLNLFTSSVVLTSETGSMTVLSSSYALTASFALNAGGGAEGRSAKLTQSSPATTWTFNHNLGEQYPEVTVYDSLGYVVIPTNILAYSNNQMIITFSSAQSGTVTATVGGGLPAISASYAGYVLSNNGTSPSWKSGMVSGSLQITEFGYATTGSNTFTNNQVINGTLTINNAKIGTVCTPLASTTTVLNLSTFDGVNMDYVIKKSGNMRAGNVMGVWSGSDVKYSETSTMDIGDTSEFTFTINNTGAVTANFTSGTWVVEIFYRAIGGCS
jgi:hypothetical protein